MNNISYPIDPNQTSLSDLREHFLGQKEAVFKSFDDFKLRADKVLEQTKQMLRVQMDNDPSQIEMELGQLTSISYTLGLFVSKAKNMISIYEIMNYYPKTKELSEADRKQLVETKIMPQRSLLNMLVNAEEKIDKRISVLQSILKMETERWKKGS